MAQDAGQGVGDRLGIGPVEHGVGQVDRLVAPHGQRPAGCLGQGCLRPDGHHGHLSPVGLPEAECLLDRHLVHGVEDRLVGVAHQREVGGVQVLVGGSVGDPLDADGDVQWHRGLTILHLGLKFQLLGSLPLRSYLPEKVAFPGPFSARLATPARRSSVPNSIENAWRSRSSPASMSPDDRLTRALAARRATSGPAA